MRREMVENANGGADFESTLVIEFAFVCKNKYHTMIRTKSSTFGSMCRQVSKKLNLSKNLMVFSDKKVACF